MVKLYQKKIKQKLLQFLNNLQKLCIYLSYNIKHLYVFLYF